MSLHSVPREISFPPISNRDKEGIKNFIANYGGRHPVIVLRKESRIDPGWGNNTHTSSIYFWNANTDDFNSFWNSQEWDDSSEHKVNQEFRWDLVLIVDTYEDMQKLPQELITSRQAITV